MSLFTAPAMDGGSAIVGYQYSTDAGATWRDRQTGSTESPLRITTTSSDPADPLIGGQPYPVEIRALNAVGAGAASAVATGITRTVPGEPVILSVDTRDASASIRFTPPANGGSAIIEYQYRLDQDTWYSTGSLADEFVLSGLTNSVTYSLEIRAVNGVGDGPASDPQSVEVFTTPAAPALGAIVAGDETLAVGFTATGDGGSPITGYEYSTDGGATWRSRVSGTTGTPLLITTESGAGASTLTNATIYAVQLRAVNAAGAGAASETVLAAPRGTPSAPTAMNVAAGDGALVVTFTSGDDRGSPITAIEYRLNDTGEWIDPGSLASPLTVGGLNNGELYSIAVRALNAVGPGTASVSLLGHTEDRARHAHGGAGRQRIPPGHRLLDGPGDRWRSSHHRLHGLALPAGNRRHRDRDVHDAGTAHLHGERVDQRHDRLCGRDGCERRWCRCSELASSRADATRGSTGGDRVDHPGRQRPLHRGRRHRQRRCADHRVPVPARQWEPGSRPRARRARSPSPVSRPVSSTRCASGRSRRQAPATRRRQ